MKIAVVTASIGESRRRQVRLLTPAVVVRGVEYLCFSDIRHKHDVWKTILREPVLADPVRDAKRFKVLIHDHVDADASIWIDRHCRLLCDPEQIFDQFEEPIALVNHWRNCVYHEARACLRKQKDDPNKIRKVVAEYRKSHPPRWGLFYGGLIFRRHTPDVADFNRRWWRLIRDGSRRDQLSLPVALRESQVAFHASDRSELPNLMAIRSK